MKLKKVFMGLVSAVFALTLFVGASASTRYSSPKSTVTPNGTCIYRAYGEFGSVGFVNDSGKFEVLQRPTGVTITATSDKTYTTYARVWGKLYCPSTTGIDIYCDIY